jgi:phosphoribosyl-dephospho-CoA transferase
MVQAQMTKSGRGPEPGRPDVARAGLSSRKQGLRKRHNLLDLTDEGRKWALAALAPSSRNREAAEDVRRLVMDGYGSTNAPGIARREESPNASPELVPVGFVSPWLDLGGRVRVATFVLERHVSRVTTPYETLRLPFRARNTCLTALALAMAESAPLGVELGVWGSASLEIYTRRPYTHDGSDLDLLVKPAPEPTLRKLLSLLQDLETDLGLRIDVEVDLPNGYGVQLKELAMDVKSVLGKGSTDVALLPQGEIWLLCNTIHNHPKGGM